MYALAYSKLELIYFIFFHQLLNAIFFKYYIHYYFFCYYFFFMHIERCVYCFRFSAHFLFLILLFILLYYIFFLLILIICSWIIFIYYTDHVHKDWNIMQKLRRSMVMFCLSLPLFYTQFKCNHLYVFIWECMCVSYVHKFIFIIMEF